MAYQLDKCLWKYRLQAPQQSFETPLLLPGLLVRDDVGRTDLVVKRSTDGGRSWSPRGWRR